MIRRRRRVEFTVTKLAPDVPGVVTLADGQTMDCEAYKREAEKTMAVIDMCAPEVRRQVHEQGVSAVRLPASLSYRARAALRK